MGCAALARPAAIDARLRCSPRPPDRTQTPMSAPAVRLPLRPLGPGAALLRSCHADRPLAIVGAQIPRPPPAIRIGLAVDDRPCTGAPA